MRLLADESLTGQTCEFLRTCGHELLMLRQFGRTGATNGEVLALAKSRRAILIAEDRGFTSVLTYPLRSHEGIIVLKVRGEADLSAIHRHLRDALRTMSPDELRGALLIIDRNKFRLRRNAS